MQLSEFDFQLPPQLIAQNPVTPRDEARLLVYDRASNTIEHTQVKHLNTFLPDQSVLVANNSRVRSSRLFALCGRRRIEVFILEQTKDSKYRCLVRGKGLATGDSLQFYESKESDRFVPLSAKIMSIQPHPSMTTYVLDFTSKAPLEDLFAQYGETPLPPYITESTVDPDRYQTVFAKTTGSAAAPTAGLHFTTELLKELSKTHPWLEVTLNVGMGTFLPLRNEVITENQLHKESTFIDSETTKRLQIYREKNIKITAIGTTSTRTLEAHSSEKSLIEGWLDTNLFIYPGYTFKTVTSLLTNFHLPKSSLLVLVAAFLGNSPSEKHVILSEEEMIKRLHFLYQTAISERYRFYSFGDAMLIL